MINDQWYEPNEKQIKSDVNSTQFLATERSVRTTTLNIFIETYYLLFGPLFLHKCNAHL